MTANQIVETLLTGGAIRVWPDTSLRDVAELFERDSIGAALVRDNNGGVAGVISERDLVRALAEGADPDCDRAEDYMTFDVQFVDAETPAADAGRRMLDLGVRHLPVRDEAGVEGVISIRDVLAALL